MERRQLNLEQAAAYLNVEPIEVSRLVRRGEIPFSGDAARPLFLEEALDAWASRRILGMNGRRLGAYDRDASAAHRGDTPFVLSSLLTPERVFTSLDARTKASVLSGLVACADGLGLLYDPRDLLESLRAREELCSTGLPGGIAVPHPRNHDPYLASESFLLVARPSAPVHFGAPDGKPTDLFFLLVCHEDRQHLRALARLCMVLGDPALTTTLRASDDPSEICAALAAAEAAARHNA